MAESFAQKNAEHFNFLELQEWPQWVLDLHRQIADFLRLPQCSAWLGLNDASDLRMLDYACGSGIVTQALRPRFHSAIGVDVSSKMVERYNRTADELSLGPESMLGVLGDFTAPEHRPTDPVLPEDQLRDFDLVAICMALHHLDDPAAGLARLAQRLKLGGTLLVIDWTPMDGSTPAQRVFAQQPTATGNGLIVPNGHPASHTVSRPEGFTEKEIRAMFDSCGCVDVRWKLAESLTDMPTAGTKLQLFWACATRAA